MNEQAVPPGQHEPVTELRIDRAGEVRVALDPYISVLALITDALGRRRGAPEQWRRRVLASLSPGGVRAILPLATPSHSVSPDCVTPENPAREVSVSDQVPPELLGRVNSASRTLSTSAVPLGALAGGTVAGALGPRASFWISGLAVAGLAAAFALTAPRPADPSGQQG